MSNALHESDSLDQRCSSTISLVNVRRRCDNHRALAHAIPAPQTGKCRRTGNAAARAFAFQGRCFGRDEACCGSARFRVVADRLFCGYLLEGAVHAARYTARCVRGLAGSTPAVPTKAPSCRQGAATPANGPAWAAPKNTGTPNHPEPAVRPFRQGPGKLGRPW
jgi:hypothetical protein